MFLNTINSADVFHMQDFFNTFMVGHCSCVVDQKFAPEFLLPERLSALGPRLAAHYVLGVFLMFPDLVLTLVNSQIITNSACSGSKIHLQVQVSFTKVCHIPMGQWLPSPRSAQPVNNEHSATSVARTADLIQLGSDSSLSAAVEQKGSIFATPGQDQPIFEQCVPSKSSSDNDSCGEKKNQLCNTMQDSYPAEGMYRLQVAQPYIPYSYIRNLSNEAAPLQNPLPSKSAGTITFYLDSNNHIQHMSMNLLSL